MSAGFTEPVAFARKSLSYDTGSVRHVKPEGLRPPLFMQATAIKIVR